MPDRERLEHGLAQAERACLQAKDAIAVADFALRGAKNAYNAAYNDRQRYIRRLADYDREAHAALLAALTNEEGT